MRPAAFSALSGSRPANLDRGPSAPIPTSPPFTAFIAGLSYSATEEDIRRFFEGCSIKSVRLPMDHATNRPRGHGFVEFDDVDSLKRGTAAHAHSLAWRALQSSRELAAVHGCCLIASADLCRPPSAGTPDSH